MAEIRKIMPPAVGAITHMLRSRGRGRFDETKHRRLRGKFADKPGAGDDAPKKPKPASRDQARLPDDAHRTSAKDLGPGGVPKKPVKERKGASRQDKFDRSAESGSPVWYTMGARNAKTYTIRAAAEGDKQAIASRLKSLPSEISLQRQFLVQSRGQKYIEAKEAQRLQQLQDEHARLKGGGGASGASAKPRAKRPTSVRAQIEDRLKRAPADVPKNTIPEGVTMMAARSKGADGVRAKAALASKDEVVETSWGAKLNARAGKDYILTDAADGSRWVVRSDIYRKTYKDNGDGTASKDPKKAVGFWVAPKVMTIQTLEGPVEAAAGDHVMVGAIGEMWPVKPQKYTARYNTMRLRKALAAIAKAKGLMRVGKPSFGHRLRFLLSTLKSDRTYRIGRYLKTRRRGGALPRGRAPRRGSYSGVYKKGLLRGGSSHGAWARLRDAYLRRTKTDGRAIELKPKMGQGAKAMRLKRAMHYLSRRIDRVSKSFDETKHKRDRSGRFARKGGAAPAVDRGSGHREGKPGLFRSKGKMRALIGRLRDEARVNRSNAAYRRDLRATVDPNRPDGTVRRNIGFPRGVAIVSGKAQIENLTRSIDAYEGDADRKERIVNYLRRRRGKKAVASGPVRAGIAVPKQDGDRGLIRNGSSKMRARVGRDSLMSTIQMPGAIPAKALIHSAIGSLLAGPIGGKIGLLTGAVDGANEISRLSRRIRRGDKVADYLRSRKKGDATPRGKTRTGLYKAKGLIRGGSKRLRAHLDRKISRATEAQPMTPLMNSLGGRKLRLLSSYLANRRAGGPVGNQAGRKKKAGVRAGLYKAAPKTLYVKRPVENAAEIIAWAKAQGFASTLLPTDMHVTLAFSKTPINWARLRDDYRFGDSRAGEVANAVGYGCLARAGLGDNRYRISGGVREVKALGDKGAVVLAFQSPALTQRWTDFLGIGASWDFPSYTPHLTITYKGKGVDLSKVSPYSGEIVLGEEHWDEIREGTSKVAEIAT